MLTRRVHSMTVIEVQNGRDVDHVAVCSCEWESLPMANRFDAVAENCAVMEAEIEGARRRGKRRQLARTA